MKKWKFSLEAVRILKKRLEEEAAQKHSQALVQLGHAKALLAETEANLQAATRDCSGRKRTSAAELMQLNQYIAGLDRQRAERQAATCEAEKLVTLARAHLEKMAREREILDRLHDRKKAEHGFHVARQEQKWLDEMAQRARRGLLAA